MGGGSSIVDTLLWGPPQWKLKETFTGEKHRETVKKEHARARATAEAAGEKKKVTVPEEIRRPRKGFSTILTGGLGVSDLPTLGRKKLLGG